MQGPKIGEAAPTCMIQYDLSWGSGVPYLGMETQAGPVCAPFWQRYNAVCWCVLCVDLRERSVRTTGNLLCLPASLSVSPCCWIKKQTESPRLCWSVCALGVMEIGLHNVDYQRNWKEVRQRQDPVLEYTDCALVCSSVRGDRWIIILSDTRSPLAGLCLWWIWWVPMIFISVVSDCL